MNKQQFIKILKCISEISEIESKALTEQSKNLRLMQKNDKICD